MLITNGKLYTMTQDKPLEGCSLRIEDGRIARIARTLKAKKGEEVLDACGAWVLPGFIDAHCHIGMDEVGVGREGDDTNEMTDPLTPEVDALDGCNPMDRAFAHAREAGVTLCMTGPGSANVLGGLFVCVKTWGKAIEETRLPAVTAMKCAFGENPRRVYGNNGKKPMTRMEVAALLRKALTDAGNYMEAKAAAEKKGEHFDLKPELEHLLPVLRREIPLKAHAHRADDILTAVRIAKEFNLKLTMDHCTEGHLIVEQLMQNDFPALIGPSLSSASKVELQYKSLKTAVELTRAGKLCCTITDHPVISIEYLPVCAGYVYKEGMPMMEALKTITLNPAIVLGIDKDYGSLEEGKVANITIYDDNPLCNLSRCLYTIGDGKVIWEHPKRPLSGKKML